MRHVLRVLVLLVVGVIASLVGVLVALTVTPPGRALLARNVSHQLETLLRGRVNVGNIDGSFLRDLVLRDVVVRDTAGVLLVSLPVVRVRYLIPNFLARRFILEALEVDHPIINLVRHSSGRWNYEEVLRLSEGPPGKKSVPPLIEFRNMKLTDGALALAYPWPTGNLTARQRDSQLAAVRAIPGRIVTDTREGTRRVLTFSNLTTAIRRLRISTPDHLPLLLVVDTLSTDANEPQLQLRQLQGTIEQQGDSLRFSLARVALPGTQASADGLVSWPRDTIMWDFRASAPRVDLVDLRFISPEFPAMTGHANIVARSLSGRHTNYALTNLVLTDGPERVEGRLVAEVDAVDGLGVRGLRLRLTELNLDKVRPYIDSLPFIGLITGPVEADGDLNDIAARGDIVFTDLAVPGEPTTSLSFDGRLQTGTGALVFDQVAIAKSDIDLRTVRNLAPAVLLDGRLHAVGTLDGPLTNTTFTGSARHKDGERPESVVDGWLRLDSRETTMRVAADVTLAPLSFEGIRGTFPTILSEGSLAGEVKLDGPVDRLFVDADVRGEIGAVKGSGTVTILPPRWGADSLKLDFRRLDLQALTGREGRTSLDGRIEATGVIDTLVAPEGAVHLVLGPGVFRGVHMDTLVAQLKVHDSMLTVDTAWALGSGLTLTGAGTLGWARPHRGRIELALEADSLVALDSLAQELTGFHRDTLPGWHTLNGVLRARAQVAGSLDSLEATGEGSLRGLAFDRFRANAFAVSGSWTGGARPAMTITATLDSMSRQDRFVRDVTLSLAGPADSVDWTLSGDDGGIVEIAGTGRAWTDSGTRALAIDTLALGLPTRAWRLLAPSTITLADSILVVTPLRLQGTDGSGFLSVAGDVPWTGAGNLDVEGLGLSVRDLSALAQVDTAGLGGWLGFRVHLGGTRSDPTMEGTIGLEDARVGDTRGPLTQGVFIYAEQRLDGGLLLYRTGSPVMQVRYSLPMDLALKSVKERLIPGPLSIQATADSVELGVLEPLTRAVRDVTGMLNADVQVGGTWDQPALGGFVEVKDGALTVEGLNVPLTAMNGRAEFRGDSILLPTLTMQSARGSATLSGTIRLERLTRPILNILARLDRFRAIEQRDFLLLTASGHVAVQGPLDSLVVSGSVTADDGALYFADLLNKRIINLEDPENLAFIDTTLVRRRGLGSDLMSRVLASIRVRDFSLIVGDDFWLRSAEANIQLDGKLRVEKLRSQYRLDGTLHAVRGTYRLSPIPGFTRDFEVVRGDVRYFGTPDLNAELDIQARHVVRTTKGQELPVIALVTGTLFDPKLKLESTQRPPLSELDIVSYLVTGAPASEATAQGGAQAALVANAYSYALSAGASVLEQTIGAQLGLDMLQIRPVVSGGGQGQSLTTAFALAAGWQLGRKVFLTFNAGFCPSQLSQFDYRNFGAGIEWRVSPEWKIQGVIEPLLRLCGVTAVGQNVSSSLRYQVGADVLWQREF
jgi:translocation and assembly module TamB